MDLATVPVCFRVYLVEDPDVGGLCLHRGYWPLLIQHRAGCPLGCRSPSSPWGYKAGCKISAWIAFPNCGSAARQRNETIMLTFWDGVLTLFFPGLQLCWQQSFTNLPFDWLPFSSRVIGRQQLILAHPGIHFSAEAQWKGPCSIWLLDNARVVSLEQLSLITWAQNVCAFERPVSSCVFKHCWSTNMSNCHVEQAKALIPCHSDDLISWRAAFVVILLFQRCYLTWTPWGKQRIFPEAMSIDTVPLSDGIR